MAVVSARSHISANAIMQFAGEMDFNRFSKCERLRFKMMLKYRNQPNLGRKIYNLDLQC